MKKVNEIRNLKGKVVATIHYDSRTKRYYIFDFWGRQLGYYAPEELNGVGRTYNFWGKIISSGDSLTSLIEDWD